MDTITVTVPHDVYLPGSDYPIKAGTTAQIPAAVAAELNLTADPEPLSALTARDAGLLPTSTAIHPDGRLRQVTNPVTGAVSTEVITEGGTADPQEVVDRANAVGEQLAQVTPPTTHVTLDAPIIPAIRVGEG